MSSFVKFDRPQLIRDGKGNLIFEHATFARGVEDVKATAAIGRGEAVIMDVDKSYLPRWDYSTLGTSDVNFGGINIAGTSTTAPAQLSGVRVASSTSICYIGVAMENIPAGVTGHVCTDGISAVKCPATLTAATVLGSAAGSFTLTVAGSVDGFGANTVVPAGGRKLGTIYVLNGTADDQMGSTTQLGVYINPS